MTIIKEEVDLAQYVERGLVGVNVDAVRDNINTYLNGTLGKCFVTPYIALERVRKVLANFHIFLPRTTFLEGDHGVEVFDIKQFGEVMGMRDDGTVVTKVSDPYSLYFEYKMNDKGMFEVFSEIVTQEELNDLMSTVEDDINDADDDREEKLDESSESVTMSGPETGARRITGQPDYGMAPDYYGGSGCDDEKPKMKLVMKKKSRLAEGEILQFPIPKKRINTEPETPKKLIEPLFRSPKQQKKAERERPRDWVDQALKQGKKPKKGLARIRDLLFKEEDGQNKRETSSLQQTSSDNAAREAGGATTSGSRSNQVNPLASTSSPTSTGKNNYMTGPGGVGNTDTKPASGMTPEYQKAQDERAEKATENVGKAIRAVVPGVDAGVRASQGDLTGAVKSAATDAVAIGTGLGVYKAAGRVIGAAAPELSSTVSKAIQYATSKPVTPIVRSLAQQNESVIHRMSLRKK